MSLNRVYLVGNAPEAGKLTTTQTGKKCYRFRLLTSEKWKDRSTGEKRERVEGHNCVVWDRVAEICDARITKGTQCTVEGSISYSSYEKDGNKVFTTDIKVSHIDFGKGQKDAGAN